MIHWFSLSVSMSFSPSQHFHRCQKSHHVSEFLTMVSGQKQTFILIIVHSKPWEHNRFFFFFLFIMSPPLQRNRAERQAAALISALCSHWIREHVRTGCWLLVKRKQSCLNCPHFSWISMSLWAFAMFTVLWVHCMVKSACTYIPNRGSNLQVHFYPSLCLGVTYLSIQVFYDFVNCRHDLKASGESKVLEKKEEISYLLKGSWMNHWSLNLIIKSNHYTNWSRTEY